LRVASPARPGHGSATDDPSHVVGHSATLQAAAEGFTRFLTDGASTRGHARRAGRLGCGLVVASVDALLSALGAAAPLGYDDGCAGYAARSNAIADVLDLVGWTVLQLRSACVTGRQHTVGRAQAQFGAIAVGDGPPPAPRGVTRRGATADRATTRRLAS
jgi:hypothetical protein